MPIVVASLFQMDGNIISSSIIVGAWQTIVYCLADTIIGEGTLPIFKASKLFSPPTFDLFCLLQGKLKYLLIK